MSVNFENFTCITKGAKTISWICPAQAAPSSSAKDSWRGVLSLFCLLYFFVTLSLHFLLLWALDVSIFQFFSYCLISSVFPFFAVQIDALNCYNFARNMCTITVQRKVITLQNNSNKKFKTWLIPHYLWKTTAKKFHHFMK